MRRKRVMKEERKRINRKMGGFTLVELIVVLVILSVLSAVAVPSVLGYIDDSKAKECRTQVETLTADISSAKMAYEANGEIGEDGKVGREFDATQIEAYIVAAGAEGRCPVDDVLYEYRPEENKIVCPKGHGEGVLFGSEKFTVAVVEDIGKRESPDAVQKYKAQIQVETGSTNMKPGEHTGLHVTVTDEHGNTIPDDRVTVTWTFPTDGSVDGKSDGTSATVEALSEGSGQVSCTVTVTKEDGTTETVPCGPIDITVTNSEPEPSVELNVQESVDLETGIGKEITASATSKGLEGQDVKYTYEWTPSDPSVTVASGSENGSTVTVTGGTAGEYDITCKVTGKYTDKNGNEQTITDEKTIHVTVKDPEPEPSVELFVPGNVALETNAGKEITASASSNGLEGKEVKYTYEWMPSDPSIKVDKTSEDGSMVTVTGGTAGEYDITCEVTGTYIDDDGNEQTVADKKTIHVSVTEPKTETPSQPELNLEVPSLTVEMGKPGQLEPRATGGSGKYTYKYESLDESTVTVDKDGNVAGVKPGKAKVKVTVTDDETKATKTVEVEVNVTEGGLFSQTSFKVWAHDDAGVDLVDFDQYNKGVGELLSAIYANLPEGKWYDVSGGANFNIQNPNNPGEKAQIRLIPEKKGGATGPFSIKFVAKDGREGILTFTVGYMIKTLQQPYIKDQNGDEAVLTTVIEPTYTTDVPLTWEVEPENLDWSYVDEKHIQIKVKKSIESECNFKARVYTTCEATNTEVSSDWNSFTLAKRELPKAISSVTLSPSPLALKVGETATLTATPECDNSSVDMSKIKYTFSCETTEVANVEKPGQQLSDNKTTVMGLNAGNTKIKVDVFYDDSGMTYAQCDVTVLKEEEVLIDAKKFKANSWDDFKAAVAATTSDKSYKINQNKNKKGQDSPLYYDSDGKLYVAIGTGKSYKKTDTKGKEVLDSNSFADYISKGNDYTEEEFAPINMPVQVADTVKWSDLGSNSKVYNIGEIIKVIRDDRGGEVEYYITNVKASSKRVQSDIKTDEHEGWWKLDVFP